MDGSNILKTSRRFVTRRFCNKICLLKKCVIFRISLILSAFHIRCHMIVVNLETYQSVMQTPNCFDIGRTQNNSIS